MKKFTTGLFFALFLILSAGAQDGGDPEFPPVQTRHYQVFPGEAGAGAELLSRELEQRFTVYNRLFRFNPENLTAPLKVRVFTSPAAYDGYVSARLGSTRPGAIYLHYNQKERRELVIHQGGPEEDRMLPHQAFIQYLRAFVSNPPAWIREGFAIYFNTLKFNRDPEEGLIYTENLSWLETVKKTDAGAGPLKSVLLADTGGAPEHLEGLSWALVSFFLNRGKEDYFRTLIESFMILSQSATAAENTEAVMNRISLWTDFDSLERDYRAYIASRKTFAELVEEGHKAYAAKDPAAAEISFLNALDQKPDHHVPYYYLGLLAYEEKNYDIAEHYYRSALQYGADAALISYARGINAASAGRNAEGIRFLQEAAAASPARYKERVEGLLSRLSR